jgi:Abnormal spindle-like microcephaly-assoc'd, ASPM-SPD-2-Hydin
MPRTLSSVLVVAAACALVPAATAGPPQLQARRHLNFGNAPVQSSAEFRATLTNRGRSSIHIFGIGVSSTTGSFTIGPTNNCTGATLPPHGSCTYGIVYAPVKPGRQVGASDVEYGAAGLAVIRLSAHATGHAIAPPHASRPPGPPSPPGKAHGLGHGHGHR